MIMRIHRISIKMYNTRTNFTTLWKSTAFAVQRVLCWLHLCPSEEDTANKWQKSASIALYSLVLITFLSYVATSLTYFATFSSTDLEQSLYALLQVTAFIGLAYIQVIALFSRYKLRSMFQELSNIYSTRKYLLKQSTNIFEMKTKF